MPERNEELNQKECLNLRTCVTKPPLGSHTGSTRSPAPSRCALAASSPSAAAEFVPAGTPRALRPRLRDPRGSARGEARAAAGSRLPSAGAGEGHSPAGTALRQRG